MQRRLQRLGNTRTDLNQKRTMNINISKMNFTAIKNAIKKPKVKLKELNVEVILYEIMVEFANKKERGKNLRVSWGFSSSKQLGSKLATWEPNFGSATRGLAVWPNTSVLDATVDFQEDDKGGLHSEDWTISVEIETTSSKKFEELVVTRLNLGDHLEIEEGTEISINLRFPKLPADVKEAYLSLKINLDHPQISRRTSKRTSLAIDQNMTTNLKQKFAASVGIIKAVPEEDMEEEILESIEASIHFQTVSYALLLWVKCIVKNYPGLPMKNFSSSFRNGMALCAIVHHYHPDLIDFESLAPSDVKENLGKVFKAASQLGVTKMFSSADMLSPGGVDQLTMVTYLYQLWSTLQNRKASSLLNMIEEYRQELAPKADAIEAQDEQEVNETEAGTSADDPNVTEMSSTDNLEASDEEKDGFDPDSIGNSRRRNSKRMSTVGAFDDFIRSREILKKNFGSFALASYRRRVYADDEDEDKEEGTPAKGNTMKWSDVERLRNIFDDSVAQNVQDGKENNSESSKKEENNATTQPLESSDTNIKETIVSRPPVPLKIHQLLPHLYGTYVVDLKEDYPDIYSSSLQKENEHIAREIIRIDDENREIDEKLSLLVKEADHISRSLETGSQVEGNLNERMELIRRKFELAKKQMQLAILEKEIELDMKCRRLNEELQRLDEIEEWRRPANFSRRESKVIEAVGEVADRRDALLREMERISRIQPRITFEAKPFHPFRKVKKAKKRIKIKHMRLSFQN